MLERVRNYCEQNNISISEKQLSQMNQYCSFLAEKNQVMNLTAIIEPDEMEVKHLIDSLSGLPVITELWDKEDHVNGSLSLIDIGCGAGLPGIPLKIMFPDADFVLLDSLHKRISFVKEAAERIGLDRIECIAERAEEFADNSRRETFDFCISRAVAEANVLLEYCLPFVKIGGYCVLYKADSCDEEMQKAENAMKVLGGQLKEIRRFSLPENAGGRSLVIIQKIAETPSKYPRRPGKPSKNPL